MAECIECIQHSAFWLGSLNAFFSRFRNHLCIQIGGESILNNWPMTYEPYVDSVLVNLWTNNFGIPKYELLIPWDRCSFLAILKPFYHITQAYELSEKPYVWIVNMDVYMQPKSEKYKYFFKFCKPHLKWSLVFSVEPGICLKTVTISLHHYHNEMKLNYMHNNLPTNHRDRMSQCRREKEIATQL